MAQMWKMHKGEAENYACTVNCFPQKISDGFNIPQ